MKTIDRPTHTSVKHLDVVHNSHDWSYKIPGILVWGVLVLCIVGIFAFPHLLLIITRCVGFYMLARILVIIFFYVIGLLRIRKNVHRWAGNNFRQVPNFPENKIHHIVLIPNYNEPIEILDRTIQALTRQDRAKDCLTVVLAMEESEADAFYKADQLSAQYGHQFAHFLVTFHPGGIPGEAPGKGSNESWAARQVCKELVQKLGMPIEWLTLTTCDADSRLHPAYFSEISRQFYEDSNRYCRIWQAPLLFDNNIWQVPSTIRLMTFFSNAVQVSELANPLAQAMPLSTYTLSFKLADEVGYWDPAVIAEDWHMFLRCFFGAGGKVTLKPVFLPTTGDAIDGENIWTAWKNFYNQQLRHAWGGQDIGYIFQQVMRRSPAPAPKVLLRAGKIMHDHLLFSTSTILLLVGTALSIALDGQYVLTFVAQSLYPTIIALFNGLGAVAMWGIWAVERTRVTTRARVWRLTILLQEIAAWAMIPIITLVLAGLPVLHAQTKLLLGSELVYHPAPKIAKAE